ESETAYKIALLGNVTCDVLEPFMAVASASAGLRITLRFGGFGQYFQDLQGDACQGFDPQILFLMLSLEMLRPDAVGAIAARSAEGRMQLRDEIVGEIRQWIDAAEAATTATLLIANFPPPPFPALGIADAAEAYGEAAFYYDLNLALLKLASDHYRVQIVDLAGIVARIGSDQALDRRMFHFAKVGWTERAMAEIGRVFARHLIAATGRARKCLVLDADNTLWGGVLGEDGPWGIRIDTGDPSGEAFRAFQRRIKALKDRGIVLALCSKNNPAEIDALFQERPDMPLQAEDFAARSVGWSMKSKGLIAIAQELNIGLDALVFLDDNPAEVEQVRATLPMVEAVLLPDDVASYEALLDRLPWFEKSRLTAEDAQKSDQYAQAAARQEALDALPEGHGYLEGLGITLEIHRARTNDLPRLHQLFTKTNQFNVTTIRYSPGELAELVEADDVQVDVAFMHDRFGDMGMIAAIVTRREDATCWHIDSFVMSCRAMGRGAEMAILHRLQKRAEREGGAAITAEYRPTPRNAPVATLFEDHGFAVTGQTPDGYTQYAWIMGSGPAEAYSWINLREDQAA
ncbi:MAG: HAD-IIIC family phosphatase, partial [Sphingobium sp.]